MTLIENTNYKFYLSKTKLINSKNLNLNILNNLNLNDVDILKFPTVKLLNQMPKRDTLWNGVATINDYFVYKFLENKINFEILIKLIIKFSKLNDFTKYKKIKPKNIEEIYKLRDYVSFKLSNLSIYIWWKKYLLNFFTICYYY